MYRRFRSTLAAAALPLTFLCVAPAVAQPGASATLRVEIRG